MNYPRKIEIKVPCSSSNIGPGFDVLGVTLELFLSVELEIKEKKNNKKNYNDEVVLTYSGEGSDTIPLKIEKNLITKTALYVLACNNISGFTSPINIHVKNPIPLGRGLGSSGAAVVAGVLLGDIVGNLGLKKDRMLDYCLMIEHHPDNVTAALMGGFIASYSKELVQTDTETKVIPHSETLDENGNSVIKEVPAPDVPKGIGNYIKLNWSKDIKAITIIPQFEVATATARSVLPDKYEKEDVVFNLQRLAVLTMALSHSPPKPELIYHAMQDKIHQPYRKHLIPGLTEILVSVNPSTHPGLLGICLSGAGPTILVLATHNFDNISKTITNVFSEKGIDTVVKLLEIVNEGAKVTEIH